MATGSNLEAEEAMAPGQSVNSLTNSSGLGFISSMTPHADKKYEEIKIIGNGAYGTVYCARSKDTDEIVAMKKVRFKMTEDGVPMAILREISLLKQLEKFDHPNIVKLLDVCHGSLHDRDFSLYLVFEHVDQDLSVYLEKCPPPGLSQDKIRHLFFQILCGVDFLHSHRIVHRDLKPHNLLVSNDGQIKLTDFGLARIYDFQTVLTSVVVTLWYRCPEVLFGMSYATPIDLWSCGCIFAELLTRKPLFPGKYELDQLTKIFEIIGIPAEEDWPSFTSIKKSTFRSARRIPWTEVVQEIDPEAEDLISQLLSFNPSHRPTAKAALQHPYFRNHGLGPAQNYPGSESYDNSDCSFDSNMSSSSQESGA